MNTVRIVSGLLLSGVGIYISSCNWWIFYLGRIKRVHSPSWIPLFGGILGAAGTFLLLPGHLARWCWIWLLLDWGSVPGITESVIYSVEYHRRERRKGESPQESPGTAVEPGNGLVQEETLSEVLVDRGRMYALFSDGKGGLLLEVICGSIAMYGVTVALSPEEAEAFKREGKPFLDSLAYRIARGLDDRANTRTPERA